MNRRTFLIGGAAAVAGCARPAAPPTPALATPQLTDADRDRIAAELAERERHLKLLEGFRVAPNAARTTPPPPADVLAFAPELKPLVKVALRLHPRFGEELPAEATKLGGKFRWPRSEPWPQCEEHRIPFVPVLQLRAEDAPPQFAFRERSDLLQLLWCPRDHGNATVKPLLVWRKQADTPTPYAEPPRTDEAFLGYVPVPCRVFPERVAEFPPWDAPPKVLRDKLATWSAPPHPDRPNAKPSDYYADLLSAAAGTKVGGYPRLRDGAKPPACEACKWGMDFLLSVSATEWGETDRSRWMPVEERDAKDAVGYRRAAGLSFGERESVQVFVCRRCDGWPVRAG